MQYGDHDLEDINQEPQRTTHTHTTENQMVLNQYKALEEIWKVVEGYDDFNVDGLEMGLVPNMVVLSKLKVPDFWKYNGLTCLRNHLHMYCTKMHAYAQE